MGSFVGVHSFKVIHMPHNLKFFRDTVAAMHVTCKARYIKRFATIVAFVVDARFSDSRMRVLPSGTSASEDKRLSSPGCGVRTI